MARPGGQAYADYLTQQAAGRVPSFGASPAAAPRVTGDKPFAGYTPPPVYSPYYNLYRNDGLNSFGLNNYYSWVLPAQRQIQQNQQFRTEIQGLQNTARQQRNTLQDIEMRQPVPASPFSGGRPPARFMDLQGYYPGLR